MTVPSDSTAAAPPQPPSEGYVWQPPLPPLAGPPSPPPPARRFVVRPLAAGLLALGIFLLVAAGAGAFVAYRAIFGHDDRVTADYAPANAYAYVAVNTDPTSRAWIDAWGVAKRTGVADDLRQLPGRLAARAGQDASVWNDLAKPVIGQEVGLVVWPGATPDDPRAAGIVMTSNADKARQLIPRLLGDAPLTAATYRDVTYQATPDGPAAGVVDGALVVASSDAAFKQVVDAHLDGALGAAPRFTAAAARAADNPLVFAWLDSGAIAREASSRLGGELGLAATAGVSADAGLVTVTVRARDDTLRVSALTDKQPGGSLYAAAPGAADAFAGQLPGASLAYLAGSDFYARVWQPLTAQLNGMGGAQTANPDAALPFVPGFDPSALGSMLGVDVERDLLAHMSGPFAVAANAETRAGDYAVGAHVMTRLDDPDAVRATIGQLADALAEQGAPVTRTADGFSGARDNVRVDVAVAGDALRLDVAYGDPSAGGALADDAAYRRAMAALPAERAWTGYVALGQLLDLVPADEWATVDPDAQTVLQALDALAISTGADGRGTRTDVVISFAP